MTETKFFIQKGYDFPGVVIWARQFFNGKEYNLQPHNSGLLQKKEVVKPGEFDPKIKPFLRLDPALADQLFRAVVEFANENNIKTPDHNLIEGKLKATQDHLADMQKAFNALLSQIEKI